VRDFYELRAVVLDTIRRSNGQDPAINILINWLQADRAKPDPVFRWVCPRCGSRFRDPELLGDPGRCAECGGGLLFE